MVGAGLAASNAKVRSVFVCLSATCVIVRL